MKWIRSVSTLALLVTAGILMAQNAPTGNTPVDDEYLSITVLPGWSVRPAVDQRLNLVKGKYLLTINPVFTHASGIQGGRFSEIVEGMPSVNAVMRDVDGPAAGDECALNDVRPEPFPFSGLYTDNSKTGRGCVFPSSGPPAWFGSIWVRGDGPESEYTITLSYDTSDVNALPRKGSGQLAQTFAEVASMLKTLRLKPPIVISSVSPQSAAPGETVKIQGSGFRSLNSSVIVSLAVERPNQLTALVDDLDAAIDDDGKSLTFDVPTSIVTASCQEGRIWTDGFCLPIPPAHIDVNDCPRKNEGPGNLCGIPIPPGSYKILVGIGSVGANPLSFTVLPPQPRAVAIFLMYPVYLVSEGNLITIRGSGFAANGNSVRIGDAIVDDLPSDGKTITLRAPGPAGSSLVRGTKTFKVSVINSNGESNPVRISYR